MHCATEPIDDTSTGKLMEGVLAAFAQFDNDVRSERTRGGMRAALELGRWTFLAPLGYLDVHRTTGRSLIPDPGRASLVRRAFQDFATGRFTKHEVRKNVNALGLTTRRGKPVPSQTFDAMLRNRAYIAQIDVPEFGISRRGDFEPLITDHDRADGPPLLPARGNGRRRHPGVRRTRSSERVEPLGPVLARSEAAPAAGVLSGWSSLRRERLVGTGATLPVFNYLNPIPNEKKELVGRPGVRTRDAVMKGSRTRTSVLQLIRQHALWVLRRMHVDVGAGSALTIVGRSATTCMPR